MLAPCFKKSGSRLWNSLGILAFSLASARGCFFISAYSISFIERVNIKVLSALPPWEWSNFFT